MQKLFRQIILFGRDTRVWQTDRQTDRRTDGHSDSKMLPFTTLMRC